MPLDPRAKRFLDRLAALNPPSVLELSVEQRRRGLQQMMSFSGDPPPVRRIEDRSIPGPAGSLLVRIYTPAEEIPEPLPALVYFHGGGLVAGNLDTHDAICRSLTHASGCRLLSVDYRLAPESPFPAAVSDAYAATVWIAAHASMLGIDPKRIGICGDSA